VLPNVASVKIDVWDYQKPVSYIWIELLGVSDPRRYLAESITDRKTSFSPAKKVVVLNRYGSTSRSQRYSGILVMQDVPPGGKARFKICAPKDNSSLTGSGPPYGEQQGLARWITLRVTRR